MSFFSSSTGKDVVATAIARNMKLYTTLSPPASGNIWLSGMPYNTTNKNFRTDDSTLWDNSGSSTNQKQRPLSIDLSSINLSAGDLIRLEGITGTAAWHDDPTPDEVNDADGDPTFLVANGVAPATSAPTNSNNGMSNTRAPIGAVMAVFLNDNSPTTGTVPACLDFGTAASRDYTTLSPKLKQVFFVGDGKKSDGTPQTITIPTGATRLFMGAMDAWQWNDNSGNFQTKLYLSTQTQLLK